MAVVHITEEEAVKDFADVLSRIDEGNAVVIERKGSQLELVLRPRMRTVKESLAILDALPGERGFMDEEFARDVRKFRERHPESLDSSKWD
jgi:hypothetical protein